LDLPTAADIAREIPVLGVELGGSIELDELRHRITRAFWNRIATSGSGVDYLNQALDDAIAIAFRNGLISTAGTRLIVSPKGWEQAALIKGSREAQGGGGDSGGRARRSIDRGSIGMRRFLIGDKSFPATATGATIVRAAIAEATAKNGGIPPLLPNGQPLSYPPLGRSGQPYAVNAWRMIEHEALIQEVIAVEMEGGDIRPLAEVVGLLDLGGSNDAALRPRRGRRPGASWPRIVCEVIAEAGGHADWPSIAAACARRSEADDNIAWREEARQALRNNTVPNGRGYFSLVELPDGVSYALTDAGRKLANKRTQDGRAPTLTKYLAEAADPHGSGKLTDMELYALLFLATQLGMANEARMIYHKLPVDFPDEDRYAMIPMWIDQAEGRLPEGED